jgi:hypothetical protein
MDLIKQFEENYGVEVPKRRIVCPNCDGTGSHVNRAIDGNGITRDQFDEDPDFEEDYFAGVYDVPCDECHGRNVVEEIDEERCDPDTYKDWIAYVNEVYNSYAIEAQERRMGA